MRTPRRSSDTSLVERSFVALRLLGVTDGNLRVRLASAWRPWEIIGVKELQGDCQDRFDDLYGKLGRGDRVTAAIARMRDAEVLEVAKAYFELCQAAIYENLTD